MCASTDEEEQYLSSTCTSNVSDCRELLQHVAALNPVCSQNITTEGQSPMCSWDKHCLDETSLHISCKRDCHRLVVMRSDPAYSSIQQHTECVQQDARCLCAEHA